VRELRNVIERAMIFADGEDLRPEHLPPLDTLGAGAGDADAAGPDAAPPGASLAEAERAHIQRTLAAYQGNVQRAAEALGISRKSLWEKRKKYGLLD
jgi:DNA-binding NtrC family response regulator